MSGLGRIAAVGASITLFSQVARLSLQLTSLLVISRILSPAEIGLVAMVTAVIGVAEIIRDFGLSSGAIQAKELSRPERDNLFWINLAVGLGCSLVAAASAPLLGWFYDSPAIVPVTLALAWTFTLSGATTQYRASLTRELRFKELALIDIASQAIATTVAITCALRGWSYWAIVVQLLTAAVAMLVLNLVVGRWLPRLPRRDVSIRRFFQFGLPILGTNVMGYLLNNADTAGLGAVWGAGPVGLYNRAYQLLLVPLSLINGPLNSVAMPVLARVREDEERFELYVRRFHLLSAYLFGIALAVMAGLAGPIVTILLGDQWHDAAPLVSVLAISGVFKALTMVFYQVYVSRGQTHELFMLYLKTRPVMLAVILAGLPWGPLGLSIGHLVAHLAFWVYSLVLVGKITRLPVREVAGESARAVAVVSLPAGAVAYGVTTLVANPWLAFLAGGLASPAWIAAAVVAAPPVRRDVRLLWESLRLALPGRFQR